MSSRTTGGIRLIPILLFLCTSAAVLVVRVAPSGAATPTVSITPSGPYHDGEVLTVSVGPNSLFTSDHRIIIIECSDAGGNAAGLPTSVFGCDGNTVQADTVLVSSNGSFSEHHFVLYSLPNQGLAELPDGVPVCNSTHPCALYVGENQEDFTQPKLFSAAFTVAPLAGSTPTASGSNPTSPAPSTATQSPSSPTSPTPVEPTSAPTLAGVNRAVTLSPGQTVGGTLAFTGMRPIVLWLIWIGSLLVLLGSLIRQVARRRWA